MEVDMNINMLNQEIFEMNRKVEEIEQNKKNIEESVRPLFEELGRKTYGLHKMDKGHENQKLIDQLNEKYSEIVTGNNEILRIKDEFKAKRMTKPCSYCGTLGSDTAKFCRACGKTFAVIEVKPKALFCSKCGSKLEEDSVFCSFCGQKLE